jgi:uncharacterized DUF497 family protein
VISVDGSYEWDAPKDRANRRKLGVSFEEAATALNSPDVQVDDDGSGRGRARGIGYSVRGRLLTAVVAEECGERDRIISAWKATREERRLYMARSV